MREGAAAFHAGARRASRRAPALERIRLALARHLRVVAEQLDIATVFMREWRYLEGDRRDRVVVERRRYEERVRALFRDGVERGELRTDLDAGAAALLVLSAANWAYTWLSPGRDTDALADRFDDHRRRDSRLLDALIHRRAGRRVGRDTADIDGRELDVRRDQGDCPPPPRRGVQRRESRCDRRARRSGVRQPRRRAARSRPSGWRERGPKSPAIAQPSPTCA